jgi:hypothetical protein
VNTAAAMGLVRRKPHQTGADETEMTRLRRELNGAPAA